MEPKVSDKEEPIKGHSVISFLHIFSGISCFKLEKGKDDKQDERYRNELDCENEDFFYSALDEGLHQHDVKL